MEKDWEIVYFTDKPYQAQLVKQLLLNNNIEAVILNQHDSTYQSFGNAEVYVNLKDKEKASQLIKDSKIE